MERVVAAGRVVLGQGSAAMVLAPGQFLDLQPGGGACTVRGLAPDAMAVRLTGDWPGAIGGCGVFTVENIAAPSDRGDPVGYPKATRIDRHYHDCDEYWILLTGRATAVVGDEAAEMAPGDCLCIGMGRHHDMPQAPDPVTAVYFETSLERQRRIGHLWEHTHGPAVPAEGRDR
jgi:mannose-6-phosphate isomerase-like protein (cupin superfamily)